MSNPILKAGDTIGVISVTAPAQPERFQKGIRYLEQCGYDVKTALTPTTAYGTKLFLFSSDTPSNRAKGLHALFADPEVKAIICTRGAYGSMEVLPHLDFDLIAKTPKPLIGYSDITALLVPLALKANCPVIHGPVIEFQFAKAFDSDSNSREAVARLLTYLLTPNQFPLARQSFTHVSGDLKFQGQVVGGNLSVFTSLVGTAWQPDMTAKILFLEEIGEAPFRVHRNLLQLKNAGMFEGLAGILLGDFTDCVHTKGLGPTVDDALHDIFKDVKAPLVRGLPCGHGDRNMPLPFTEIIVEDGKVRAAYAF